MVVDNASRARDSAFVNINFICWLVLSLSNHVDLGAFFVFVVDAPITLFTKI